MQELNHIAQQVSRLRGIGLLIFAVIAVACFPYSSPSAQGDIGYIALFAVAVGLCVGDRK